MNYNYRNFSKVKKSEVHDNKMNKNEIDDNVRDKNFSAQLNREDFDEVSVCKFLCLLKRRSEIQFDTMK